eukprot:scaffold185155_cov22-Tisochrysis_lutea.AAC.1
MKKQTLNKRAVYNSLTGQNREPTEQDSRAYIGVMGMKAGFWSNPLNNDKNNRNSASEYYNNATVLETTILADAPMLPALCLNRARGHANQMGCTRGPCVEASTLTTSHKTKRQLEGHLSGMCQRAHQSDLDKSDIVEPGTTMTPTIPSNNRMLPLF